VLDEDEERVLQVVPRELEAVRNLRQLQRSVAEEAFAHLLREGDRAAGVRSQGITRAAVGRKMAGGGGGGEGTYCYEGPEVIGDEAGGEGDAMLRHHGRRRRGGCGLRVATVASARDGGDV
jgi:hypothetical protein